MGDRDLAEQLDRWVDAILANPKKRAKEVTFAFDLRQIADTLRARDEGKSGNMR